ncbi:MAG: hypothetical protein KJ676_12350 [Alphaproteobacteria bacterium]|nr:hypothetical protein [Alphaproteobacteria bacterium]MBU1525087.1 hypothetical protein [Alphaproteobacteria bacterium]MBU2116302.1 hypothetical protein [Alphaproteobacteria bacterium]MBU2351327.1 hypothetical protein [Alphaproteobacteria bacterium]MBU2381478.1 hypothetical protein [Alphaproteobacteria bacterium]
MIHGDGPGGDAAAQSPFGVNRRATEKTYRPQTNTDAEKAIPPTASQMRISFVGEYRAPRYEISMPATAHPITMDAAHRTAF